MLEKIVNETPRPPSETRREVSCEAQTICLKCLEKSPDHRYQTARQLAEDCSRLLAGEPISARPASALSVARRKVVRHRVPLLAGLALVVIAALGAWVALLRSSGEGTPTTPTAVSGPKEKLADIRGRMETRVEDYPAIRTALQAFPSFFPDAQEEIAEAKLLLTELDERYSSHAEKALVEAATQALELAGAGKVDEAKAKVGAVRDRYARGSWLAERGEDLIAAALEDVDRAAASETPVVEVVPDVLASDPFELAERGGTSRDDSSGSDDPDTHVVEVTPVRHTGVARDPTPVRSPVRTPAERPRPAPRRDDARLVERALGRFESLVKDGDYGAARKAAEEAAETHADASGVDALRAAVRVAALLEERPVAARRALEARTGGKVALRAGAGTVRGELARVTDAGIVLRSEYTINGKMREKLVTVKWQTLSSAQVDDLAREGGWGGEGADAAAVRAYLALGRKDESAVMEALDAAGPHPLTSRLRKRIKEAGLAAIEEEARDEWSKIEGLPAVRTLLQHGDVPSSFGRKGWLSLGDNLYRVYAMAFSPDGSQIAAGGYASSSSSTTSPSVRLWDTSTGRKVKDFSGLGRYARAVAFSPDGKMIAAADSNGTIGVWDMSDPTTPKRLPGHATTVSCLVFSPNGRYLASEGSDATLFLWDLQTGAKVISEKGVYSTYRNAMAFSPDGRWLAAGGYRSISLWSLPTCVKGRTLTGHSSYVTSAAFSPNSRFLVTGGYDRTAVLWSVLTGTRVRDFDGFFGRVIAVAFLRNGRTLAVGCGDGSVEFWDCSANRKTKTMQLRTAAAATTSSSSDMIIAFSADGRYVAAGGYSVNARIWRLDSKLDLGAAEAKSLTAKIVAFRVSYGRTKFAQSMQGTIAKILAALSESRR